MIIAVRTAEPVPAHARVLELVAERYGGNVFLPVDSSADADFEVRVTPAGTSPIGVDDGSRHLVLFHRLVEEFGPTGVKWEEPAASEVQTVRRLKIDGAAQRRAFQEFLRDLPAFLHSLFPVREPKSETELRLGEIELISPQPTAEGVSSRWTVHANFTLVDTAQGATIDAGRYPWCNFFGVSDEGTVNEPGRKHRRPFDEVAFEFRRTLRDWLQNRAAERLKSSLKAGKGSLERILDLGGAEAPGGNFAP